MKKKFDPTKPVRTRDGQQVRIICTDRPGDYPIVALVGKAHTVRTYTARGTLYLAEGFDSEYDLVNIPEVKKTYRGVLKSGGITHPWPENVYETSEHYVAVLVTTFEDGEVVDIEYVKKED